MTDVVSIKFKTCGKVYYFAPNGTDPKEGDRVVVETANGKELAWCSQGVHGVQDDRVVQPLQPVVRVATAADLRVAENNKRREAEAFEIGRKKIAEHGLDMKLVDVECNFEGNKITFFFTSDGRVDFRELVKDLASVFRSRIELRQIGVRDEAKMLGGIGICGRPFCCSQFLNEFYPVSTKMAKVQNLSLNPKKISGCCGRLMCCLRYEQEAYEGLVKTVPKNGAFVQTPDGYGNVTQVNLLRQCVKVKLDGDNPSEQRTYTAEQVAAVPGGRPRDGEQPPCVLHYVPPAEPKEKEPEVDEWADIVLLDEYEDPEKRQARKERLAAAEKAEQEARANYENQRRNRSGSNRRRSSGSRRGRSGQEGQEGQKVQQPEREKPAAQAESAPKQQQKKKQPAQQQAGANRKPRQPRQTGEGQKQAQPSRQEGQKQARPAGEKPSRQQARANGQKQPQKAAAPTPTPGGEAVGEKKPARHRSHRRPSNRPKPENKTGE